VRWLGLRVAQRCPGGAVLGLSQGPLTEWVGGVRRREGCCSWIGPRPSSTGRCVVCTPVGRVRGVCDAEGTCPCYSPCTCCDDAAHWRWAVSLLLAALASMHTELIASVFSRAGGYMVRTHSQHATAATAAEPRGSQTNAPCCARAHAPPWAVRFPPHTHPTPENDVSKTPCARKPRASVRYTSRAPQAASSAAVCVWHTAAQPATAPRWRWVPSPRVRAWRAPHVVMQNAAAASSVCWES
jgi:hypothetical protein